MEKLVSLCKRRGFIFQSSEIYGGINACWDYGPLGVNLKNNVKRLWWEEMTQKRDDVEGLDAAILMHPMVWKASGHVDSFTDPMVDCKNCKQRFRADEVDPYSIPEADSADQITLLFDQRNLLFYSQEGFIGTNEIMIGNKGDDSAFVTMVSLELPDRRLVAVNPPPTFSLEDTPKDQIVWLTDKGKQPIPIGLTKAVCFFPSGKNFSLTHPIKGKLKIGITTLRGPVGATFEFKVRVVPLNVLEDIKNKRVRVCPICDVGELTDIRQFNLMFKTFMGPVEEDAAMVYLRPETCQGIYVNFENVRTTSRQKIPFGIAQIGKSFRNEISPGNFIFRSREFEQMEMQYFVHPSEADKWFEYWKEKRMAWYLEFGIRKEKLRFRDHASDELAHYARRAVDIEYEFPFGWKELEGIHNRGDYDLSRHKEFSGRDLSYFNDATKERYIPYIIETSGGIDRALLAFLSDAYDEEFKDKKLDRVVMHFHPKLAPIKLAVLPLVNRDGMDTLAQKLEHDLRKHFPTFYDDGGTIGRRYRRQDEAGTPFGATVDSQTLQDQTVTLRDRDTMEQIRVPMKDLAEAVVKKMEGWTRKGPRTEDLRGRQGE